jgi:HK97 family phage prohead protease/HK97 family phage major capsid protein
MITKDKVLKLCVPFETKQGDGEDEDLVITGHASTNDEDRSGDVIVSDAWKKSGALANYLKNPIVLAFHDMSRPIGKTIEHDVDDMGLKITAKISKAAGDIVQLIKEGILSAFSVGFIINEADFDPKSGIFIIKDLELFEVSVVSIPANQNALFSIEKNFSNNEEYLEFRNQFIKESEETLMVDKTEDKVEEKQPIDLAALATQISTMVKGDLKAEQKAKDEKEAADIAEAEKIEATATTAAERLVKDLRKELEEKDATLQEALEGLHDTVKKASEDGELEKVFSNRDTSSSKMKYIDSSDERWGKLTTDQKDGMLYASKILGVPVTETKVFQDFVKKSGMEHWESTVTGEWEDEYSTRVQNALREQLVVEPLFTTIPMSTPTMNMPINPEAGDASWVHESVYRSSQAPQLETGDGTDTSTGAAVDHQLDEQTLIARKLATREYVGYEEEEDSIVALAPIIRDAVARRMARSSDLAFLRGTGFTSNSAAYDPILGLELRGANTTDITVAGGAAWATNFDEDAIVNMRRNLGLYGLEPENLVLLCSHDLYYELMKLQNFKTVDVLGNRATILTGEVGQLFGIRVLVSQQFDNAAITAGTVATTLGILVRPSNFVTGVLRGVMTEADRDIINQKRVLVSSRRFAFQDIITGEATVNLEIAS